MDSVKLKQEFGLSLLQKLCQDEKKNFVFSPLSLGTAFAMLSAGLRGSTKEEVLHLLGCTNEDALHDTYAGLIARLDELPLKIANKYIVQDEVQIQSKFSALLKDKYLSEVETANFLEGGREVEARVNSWVAEKTNNMIKSLLPENSLTPDTIMVLLNAVYFKGTWVQEFEPVPVQLDFTLKDGAVVKKDFISKTSKKFTYHESDKLRFVKIPYNEAGCYMVVALPIDESKHIDDILLETTDADLESAIKQLHAYRGPAVDLTMPKFKIEYDFANVKSHMQQLGVEKIFKAGDGDFSDMFANSEMIQPLCVTDVVHQSVIEVDEIGTRAAAATAMRITARCMVLNEDFLVDRPFYFGIHVGSNGACLFQGIYRA